MWNRLAFSVGIAATLGCATSQPIDRLAGDALITSKVEAKLAADPDTNNLEIDVDTRDGQVRLSGLVETEQERSEAEHLTRATEGVRGVENEIRIGDLGFGQHVSDGWILTKIRSRLTVDPEVESFNIDVDVLDGDVTLSGLVTTERVREEAARIARATDGVRSVRNRIEVR
jgi:hyperosmotically inducible protein